MPVEGAWDDPKRPPGAGAGEPKIDPLAGAPKAGAGAGCEPKPNPTGAGVGAEPKSEPPAKAKNRICNKMNVRL